MDDNQYDEWKLDTPDNHLEKFAICTQCNDIIYKGDIYIKTLAGNFCISDCFYEFSIEHWHGKSVEAGE